MGENILDLSKLKIRSLITGEELGMNGIPELDISDVEFSEDNEFVSPLTRESATIEFSVYIAKSILLYYACGKSNNWLKMHGFPMIRRIHK